MNRRKFLTHSITLGSAAALLPMARAHAADESVKGLVVEKSRLAPPANGSIPVAILISAGLNVIDFSGPWGVFESVQIPDANEPPFRLFTVAETAEVVTSGSGLRLAPHYTFANVPDVKVVVVRAVDRLRDPCRRISTLRSADGVRGRRHVRMLVGQLSAARDAGADRRLRSVDGIRSVGTCRRRRGGRRIPVSTSPRLSPARRRVRVARFFAACCKIRK